MTLILVLLGRILANPVSNVFQKLLTQRQADPLFIICATNAGLTILCLPFLLAMHPHLSAAFVLNMILVAALAVGGNAIVVQGVEMVDFYVVWAVGCYQMIVMVIPGIVVVLLISG